MSRIQNITVVAAAVLMIILGGWLLTWRTCIERDKVDNLEVNIPAGQLADISRKMNSGILDTQQLVDSLSNSRVLLVGEEHLKQEIIDSFLEILNRLPDKQLVLNLELPETIQQDITLFLNTGDEDHLAVFGTALGCLPYQDILRWCFHHKDRIAAVNAMDESQDKIRFNRRYLCTDTRNATMAETIYRCYREFPGAKIIAYGGQLHMMKSGRYKYDIPNRTPTGRRLLDMGIPADDLRVVMLGGEGSFPLAPAWANKIGAIATRNDLARLPITFFYQYPIFQAAEASELFDYYVNVGPLTAISN